MVIITQSSQGGSQSHAQEGGNCISTSLPGITINLRSFVDLNMKGKAIKSLEEDTEKVFVSVGLANLLKVAYKLNFYHQKRERNQATE